MSQPPDGKCYFCQDDSEPIAFSVEFDTHVHEACLAAQSPDDETAAAMRRELYGEPN